MSTDEGRTVQEHIDEFRRVAEEALRQASVLESWMSGETVTYPTCLSCVEMPKWTASTRFYCGLPYIQYQHRFSVKDGSYATSPIA